MCSVHTPLVFMTSFLVQVAVIIFFGPWPLKAVNMTGTLLMTVRFRQTRNIMKGGRYTTQCFARVWQTFVCFVKSKTTKSTLAGKVDFYKSGHFTKQSNTFSKVSTLPGEVEFCLENKFLGPMFNLFLNFQIWPRIYLDMFVWSLRAQRRARLNYLIFKLIKNVIS